MEKAIGEVHKVIDENLTFRPKERLTDVDFGFGWSKSF